MIHLRFKNSITFNFLIIFFLQFFLQFSFVFPLLWRCKHLYDEDFCINTFVFVLVFYAITLSVNIFTNIFCRYPSPTTVSNLPSVAKKLDFVHIFILHQKSSNLKKNGKMVTIFRCKRLESVRTISIINMRNHISTCYFLS